jgi:hypothetical protein
MAYEVWEVEGSRRIKAGDNSSAERTYKVQTDDFPTEDEAGARAALAAQVPSVVETMPLRTTELVSETTPGPNALWTYRIRWATHDASGLPATGVLGSISTTGNRRRLTHALETVHSDDLDGTAPDVGNAINVTDQGIEGTDVEGDGYKFAFQARLTNAQVAAARSTWRERAVNDATFDGYPAGEVLFLGVEANQIEPGGDWDVTWRFEQRPNKTGLVAGDLTGIPKKGHEYLWTASREQKDASASRIVRKTQSVYVNRVYETLDFSTLGIPT